jgi:hypothetical protein
MTTGDDERMAVPVWRVRHLQTIEDAAREIVELLKARRITLNEIEGMLDDALGGEPTL